MALCMLFKMSRVQRVEIRCYDMFEPVAFCKMFEMGRVPTD